VTAAQASRDRAPNHHGTEEYPMKMLPLKSLLAAGLLLASGLANAQFSSTWTVANEYDFRGFSQSAKDPALQGSLDYAFGNGFAIGAWASNIDFEPLDGDVELDLYANYTGAINDDTAWTAGVVYYAYPGSDDIGEYPEFFVGLNYGAFQFKQWYSDKLYDIDSGAYTEANATFPLPNNFSITAHAGYSWGDYWDSAGGEIFDYAVGVGYTYGKFNFSLKYTGTDASGAQKITSDVGNNEGRIVFAVSTTFPYGD
jgi:uncharacterized protein (TIGR02001 family)